MRTIIVNHSFLNVLIGFKTWDERRIHAHTLARKNSSFEVGLCPPENTKEKITFLFRFLLLSIKSSQNNFNKISHLIHISSYFVTFEEIQNQEMEPTIFYFVLLNLIFRLLIIGPSQQLPSSREEQTFDFLLFWRPTYFLLSFSFHFPDLRLLAQLLNVNPTSQLVE